MIDDTDSSIVSNYTTLKLYKKINPNGNKLIKWNGK